MFQAELRGVMAQAGATDIAACRTLSFRMGRAQEFSQSHTGLCKQR
jgi:hypothetical protein